MDRSAATSSHTSEKTSAAQRWSSLQPVIEDLYLNGGDPEGKKYTLSDVKSIMKRDYGFDASEAQYKYQLTKWKVKKNSNTKAKAGAVCKIYSSRSTSGKNTRIKLKGNLTANKLERQIKAQAKEGLALTTNMNGYRSNLEFLQPVLHSSRSILLNWNMPHRPTRMLSLQHTQGEPQAPTPSDMSIDTPSATAGLTPMAHPSPLTNTIQKKVAIDRGRLFVEGKHDELIKCMNGKERLIMSSWLYQFWLYAFKTAKYWGRGPQNWTADHLRFDKYEGRGIAPSPNTPGHDVSTPASAPTPGDLYMGDVDGFEMADTPTDLCRWSIHIRNKDFDGGTLPEDEEEYEDLDDDKTYRRWRARGLRPDFIKKMRTALRSNDFSNIGADKLPAAVPQVLRAVESEKDELLLEALGFSIMGRNLRLLMKTLAKVQRARLDVTEVYPFHLAASYLDGSDACCTILNELCFLTGELSLRRLYVDDRGYTVLDNLMIAILKSHTSCRPGDVDATRKQQKRFPGEEVDVCGRWDADSECFRLLLAKGKTSVPFSWKHKFCHTSAQSICHCINTIFGPFWAPDVNTPSGLLLQRCTHCGLKLELLPLHTLVIVALHLARRGCDGEDLFGVLAVLLCLLRNGADPVAKTSVSVQALLGTSNDFSLDAMQIDFCNHDKLDAFELASGVSEFMVLTWSIEARVGWQLFCHVLRMARDGRIAEAGEAAKGQPPSDRRDKHPQQLRHHCESCEYGERPNYFSHNKELGVLWAAAQTELLTYRRIGEDDPWTSGHFNMTTLLQGFSLRQDFPGFAEGSRLGGVGIGVLDIELVKEEMMKLYCECGSFIEARDGRCAGMEEVSAYYFANLEDWFRTKFTHFPEREWWEHIDPTEEGQHEAQALVGQASGVGYYGQGHDDDDDDDDGYYDDDDDGDDGYYDD